MEKKPTPGLHSTLKKCFMNYMARLGKGAAWLSIIFSLAYSIVQLMALLQWIPYPYDLVGMFLLSLLLAPCFVVVMVALHYTAPAAARGFTMAGIGFALVYCALVSVVYFTQLASVIPLQRKNELVDAGQLFFTGRSVMVAIDCLGYGFMSVATFFTAFAFRQYKKANGFTGACWHTACWRLPSLVRSSSPCC
jgi:hypothetical protein